MAAVAPARRIEARSVAEIVEWVRSVLGLTYREVGTLTGAATRTAQRWGDADEFVVPKGSHRAKLDQLRDLKRLLSATFREDEAAVEWLHREVPLLEGYRPIDLIRRGELDKVIQILAGSYAGAFS